MSLTEEVALQREFIAWNMRVTKGMTQGAIADKLQISQPAVCKILARRAKSMNADLDELIFEQKMTQYHLLQQIVAECLAAYENSKAGITVVTRTTHKRELTGGSEANTVTDQVTITTQQARSSHGERGYLSEARAAMRDMRHMLGIIADENLGEWKSLLPPGYDADTVVRFFVDMATEDGVRPSEVPDTSLANEP